jgi:hypothetical protein
MSSTKFVTNNKVERAGFKAVFQEIDEFQSACGGKAAVVASYNDNYPKRVAGAPQGITSANYPGRVPPGSECFWHITAEKHDTIIHIEFIAFKMAKNCKYHYVKLYSSADCRPENLTKGNEVIP